MQIDKPNLKKITLCLVLMSVVSWNKNQPLKNSLEWTIPLKHHLHADEENIGLLKQLSMRVGMMKKLKRRIPPHKMKMLVSGLFQSKLIYCITVWGRIWDIPGSLDEEKRTSASLTKDDLRKLQVLQNKCLRLITNCDYKTPTETLLQRTNMLSVNQLTAQLTLS